MITAQSLAEGTFKVVKKSRKPGLETVGGSLGAASRTARRSATHPDRYVGFRY